MVKPIDINHLLQDIQKEELLEKLIVQINKDMAMSGIEFDLKEQSSPKEIISGLQGLIHDLIKFDFNTYLNLLYRIDVSEKQIRELQETDLSNLSCQVTFVILRKEWQKVWFKSKSQ